MATADTSWSVLSTGDYVPSQSPLPSQPVDAAGGAPGNYGQAVLDLFKFGIGAWSSNKAQQNAIDYMQWQTVNGQSSRMGQPSGMVVAGAPAATGGMNVKTMLLIGGAVLVGVLLLKKVAG